MPKLYTYFGLVVFFFANEHEPLHVHSRYQDYEMKAEFILENGDIVEIKFKSVRGRKSLSAKQLADFKLLVTHYAADIVQKWIDFFVLGKNIKQKSITQRIK